MFGIGMPELLLILAVALIVIGPKKLPDLAKSLGKALGEFKRATNDLKQSIEKDTGLDEVRQNLRETSQEVRRSLDSTDARSPSVTTNPVVSEKSPPPADDEAADDEAAAALDAADALHKNAAAEADDAKVTKPQ
ncbi:MAG: twin-arginine translocase subunit TatB [Desulfatitalea sp.]|nr:twin-arginine translocase subunit TatB [Desulfatitalea sp.]